MNGRRPSLAIAAVAAVLATAVASDAPGASLDRRVLGEAIGDVLSIADEVVTRARLDASLGSDPVGTLQRIATGSEHAEHGNRIRAVRALGHYPTPDARDSLHLVLTEHGRCEGDGAGVTGRGLIYVRAALEALGAIGDPDDVGWIVPCLQAKSRDLRVAAARALRDLGASTAVCPLQRRREVEQVPQVLSAISEALREWPAQICLR